MDTIKLDMNLSDVKRRRPIKNDKLRYGYIVFCTDADTDGYSICSQLINFFYKYWPELIQHNKIKICNTPIKQAKNGKNTIDFYSIDEYDIWEKKVGKSISKWKVSYKKGLAALDDTSYKKILTEPNITVIDDDYISSKTLADWFKKGKEFTDIRKAKIQ